MDLLKRIGLLLLAAVFAYIGIFYGLLRFLQEKDSGNVDYIIQDLVCILCGMAGVFVCGRVLVRMRKEKAEMIAAQPLPEVISAGLSVKSKLIATIFTLLTAAFAYLVFNSPPSLKSTSLLFGAALMCGLFVYINWIQFDRDGETLRLDRTGIKHIWYGNIPWTQIFGISMQTFHIRGAAINVLYLGVNDWQKYKMNMPYLMRLASGSRMSLHIPLQLLNVDAVTLEKFVIKHRSLYEPPMVPGWHYSMTEAECKLLREHHVKTQDIDEQLHDFFIRKYPTESELSEAQIAEGNRVMEGLFKERADLVSKSIASSNRKLNAVSRRNKIFVWFFGIIIIATFIFYGLQLFEIYKKIGLPSFVVLVIILAFLVIFTRFLNKKLA